MPTNLLKLAEEQDMIGWNNFTEGKISQEFRKVQHEYLDSIDSTKTALFWTSQLISKLLLLIHSQWIYRNNVVHKRTRDGLKRKEGLYINSKIHHEMALGISQLDVEDRFIMNNTAQDILVMTGVEKKIWLRAIAAARLAGKNKRKRRTTAGRRIRQKPNQNEDILGDTETDSRRKRRRQWDTCSRKRVKEK